MVKDIYLKISIITLIVCGFVLIISNPMYGQKTGTVKGKVFDKEYNLPIRFANVILVGTTMGSMSYDDGSFRIVGVPAGTYKVKAMIWGYNAEILDSVIVKDKQEINLNIYLSFKWPDEVSDYTEDQSLVCEVHNIEMDKVLVPIAYRYLVIEKANESYDQARHQYFPNAEPWHYFQKISDLGTRDVLVSKERKAWVYRCQLCIEARKNWLKENILEPN